MQNLKLNINNSKDNFWKEPLRKYITDTAVVIMITTLDHYQLQINLNLKHHLKATLKLITHTLNSSNNNNKFNHLQQTVMIY
jgi:hypothetical protein